MSKVNVLHNIYLVISVVLLVKGLLNALNDTLIKHPALVEESIGKGGWYVKTVLAHKQSLQTSGKFP